MFIRGVNSRAGTGYTGDVNTAFRQGRQDAFRDYIDNFNFARKADAANNAENQINVQRIADNYAQQLQMNANGRNEVLDFVQKSDQIDGAVLEADINFAARDKLERRKSEMADDRARGYFFTEDNKANTAQVNATNSTYDLQNADLKNQVFVAGQQSQLGKHRYDAATTEGQLEGYQLLKTEMDNFYNPDNVEKRKSAFIDRVVAIAKQNGDQRSEAELKQAVLNSPDFDNNFRQYSQLEFDKIAAQVSALGGNLNDTVSFIVGNVPPQSSSHKTQQTQTKEQKPTTWKRGATKVINATNAEGIVAVSQYLGNGVYLAPDRSIVKVLPDGQALNIVFNSNDGSLLTPEKALELLNNEGNVSGVTAQDVINSLK